MLQFLKKKKKKKVCLIHQNFLVALTSLSYFKIRKKTNINILSVHINTFNIIKAIQLILLTNNIVGMFSEMYMCN